MMNSTAQSIAYVEPTIISLLILISFIYLLNVARSITRRLIYAGLIGEILVGMIYAKPLGNILKLEWQQTILDFGYIGLLLLVFEGGLETRLDFFVVKSNLFLSLVIASTGVLTPIGLSIVLCTFGFKFSFLESFAMGASLSATSLGTTVVVLSSQGKYKLNQSRMGTILIGAALLDDISGLVMASIIGKLHHLHEENLVWLISKPTISSLVMMITLLLLTRFIFARVWTKLNWKHPLIRQYSDHLLLFILIATSSATITIAAYTGASTLIGAYCCGAMLKHLDHCRMKINDTDNKTILFRHVFEKYINAVKEYLFVPFFFASIGFAVPFLDLWHRKELWQGILFSLMMLLGKFITGIWILIWTYAVPRSEKSPINVLPVGCHFHRNYANSFSRLKYQWLKKYQQHHHSLQHLHYSLNGICLPSLILLSTNESRQQQQGSSKVFIQL